MSSLIWLVKVANFVTLALGVTVQDLRSPFWSVLLLPPVWLLLFWRSCSFRRICFLGWRFFLTIRTHTLCLTVFLLFSLRNKKDQFKMSWIINIESLSTLCVCYQWPISPIWFQGLFQLDMAPFNLYQLGFKSGFWSQYSCNQSWSRSKTDLIFAISAWLRPDSAVVKSFSLVLFLNSLLQVNFNKTPSLHSYWVIFRDSNNSPALHQSYFLYILCMFSFCVCVLPYSTSSARSGFFNLFFSFTLSMRVCVPPTTTTPLRNILFLLSSSLFCLSFYWQ